MIKGMLFTLLAVFTVFSDVGEARTFTDTNGRQIEAELVAHSGDKIVLMRAGKKFTLPIATFSEPDQTYIRGWIQENPDAIDTDYKFRFYADHKLSTGQQEGGGAFEDKLKFKNNIYEMIVYNSGENEILDVTLKYEIYIADFVVMKNSAYTGLAVGADKDSKLEVLAGEFTKLNIPVKGRKDFTREFSTEFYIDRDGGKTDQAAADKVIGIKRQVYKGEKLIAEFDSAEDTSRMSKIKWQDKAPGKQER